MNVGFETKLAAMQMYAEETKSRSDATSAFADYVKSFKEVVNAQQASRKEKADKKAAEKAEQEKEDRIQELIGMIARLRQKLHSGGSGDGVVCAQIAQLEAELTMLMLFG